MELNYTAIIVATIAQFVVGAIWYTPVFGRIWGRIHGFDKVSPEEQKRMMAQMVPLLAVQLFFTLITSFVLGIFVANVPAEWNPFGLAGFMWLGFVLPANVSAVLFGGTEGRWIMPKILIMAGGSLACLMAAALVFHLLS